MESWKRKLLIGSKWAEFYYSVALPACYTNVPLASSNCVPVIEQEIAGNELHALFNTRSLRHTVTNVSVYRTDACLSDYVSWIVRLTVYIAGTTVRVALENNTRHLSCWVLFRTRHDAALLPFLPNSLSMYNKMLYKLTLKQICLIYEGESLNRS
jgi:hypothetical protein